MDFFERFQWIFMIVAMIIGLALGQIGNVAGIATYFITPFLIVMLFGVFLQTPVTSLKAGFKNAKVLRMSLVINFFIDTFVSFWSQFFFFAIPLMFLSH